MYKNQLQELAQRSCFNLPSYSCIREGPDHAPRFKVTVNFNGEAFESPSFCSTLRQAEHAAAEVALNTLAIRGPSRALAARVLDETGVYKNLLQETAHRAGLNLPVYATVRSGPGHVPVFSCTVELAGMSFTGEPARTKKQAQKNAAMAAWSSLKRLAQQGSPSPPLPETKVNEEQEQVIVARVLTSLLSSATTRSFTQNDPQHGRHHHTNIPICTKSTLPATSSLCAMQFHHWPYPSYSPEIAMYQLWQQQQLIHHQQQRLFQLPMSPSTPSMPPLFPFVQSVIHPEHCLYFPGIDHHESTSVGPRITIAASSSSLRGRSTVTIQEIQEDKPEDFPVVSEPSSRVILSEPAQESGQRTTNTGDRAHPTTIDSRFEPPVDFRLPTPPSFDSSRLINPVQGQHYPPRVGSPRILRSMSGSPPVTIRTMGPQNLSTRFPAPPRMRTGGPTCSPRPMPGRMDLGGVRHSFMAPAVRIRSVIPVCSAPPPRKMPASSHEGPSPRPEDKDHQAKESKASSELEKLEM